MVGQQLEHARFRRSTAPTSTAACATSSSAPGTGPARCGSGARTTRNSSAGSRCREVRDSLGMRSHFVAVVNDITDKKRAEQELRYLANYDTLTGLPNRALLSERLGRAIVRARRQETRVAVLFLDLDRFKDINDSLGHAAGDRLLKAAATRLQATVSASDTVARLGGDEFTVVLEDVESLVAVERMAREILIAFSRAAGSGRAPRRQHHALARHQPVPRPRPGADRPAQVRRHGDVPGQGRRPQHLPDLQRDHGRRGAPARGDHRRPAQGARPRRVPAGVPAAHVAGRRQHHRRRGAAALEQRGPGRDRPDGVHPAGGGKRPDRADRRMGAARGLPPAASAGARPA